MIEWMEIYQNRRVKLATVMTLLVGSVLFPYGWLANEWSLFGRFMEWLFATERMHVVGHLGLYGGLGTAVLLIFPQLLNRPRLYFGLMLLIGFIQEALQLMTFKHYFFSTNELFDIGVDLFAAGTVFVGWTIITQKRQ